MSRERTTGSARLPTRIEPRSLSPNPAQPHRWCHGATRGPPRSPRAGAASLPQGFPSRVLRSTTAVEPTRKHVRVDHRPVTPDATGPRTSAIEPPGGAPAGPLLSYVPRPDRFVVLVGFAGVQRLHGGHHTSAAKHRGISRRRCLRVLHQVPAVARPVPLHRGLVHRRGPSGARGPQSRAARPGGRPCPRLLPRGQGRPSPAGCPLTQAGVIGPGRRHRRGVRLDDPVDVALHPAEGDRAVAVSGPTAGWPPRCPWPGSPARSRSSTVRGQLALHAAEQGEEASHLVGMQPTS